MDPEQAIELLKPFFESSVIIASEYCKACNRNTVTLQDMEYGSKFAARYVVGIENESFFPEIYDEEESDEDYDEEESDDDDSPDDPFTRYVGDDIKMNNINTCYDTWDQWEPHIPLQIAAKCAIEKN
jgi:hypothetical protein